MCCIFLLHPTIPVPAGQIIVKYVLYNSPTYPVPPNNDQETLRMSTGSVLSLMKEAAVL